MSTLRDKVFYCGSNQKKKALVKVLLDRGEKIATPTNEGKNSSEYPYVIFTAGSWSGYGLNTRPSREVVKL